MMAYEFLPQSQDEKIIEEESVEIIPDSLCPCCNQLTIPNKGDALAYICPNCLWEIDLFIQTDIEPSDLNHGLTLVEARENYQKFGVILSELK